MNCAHKWLKFWNKCSVQASKTRGRISYDTREETKRKEVLCQKSPCNTTFIPAAVARTPRTKRKTGLSNKIRHRHGVLEISLVQIFPLRKMLRLAHWIWLCHPLWEDANVSPFRSKILSFHNSIGRKSSWKVEFHKLSHSFFTSFCISFWSMIIISRPKK